MNQIAERELASLQKLYLAELATMADASEIAIAAVANGFIASLFRSVIIMTRSIERAEEIEAAFIERVRAIGPRFEEVI